MNGPTMLQTNLCAAEQFGQRLDVVLDLDDLVVGGLDAGDLVDDRLHALAASRPAAMKGTLYSRRYSQTRRPV